MQHLSRLKGDVRLSSAIYMLIFLFIIFVNPLYSQIVIKSFDLVESKGLIFLRWDIQKGSTCNGIKILRCTDGVTFSQIGIIYGICGSNFEDQHFTFTDSLPIKNHKNFYTLDLGGLGFSPVIEFEFIDFTAKAFQLRYTANQLNILFANENAHECQLRLFTILGQEMNKLTTSNTFFALDLDEYQEANYFFEILDRTNNQIIRGSFIGL